ncbi:ribokinase [Paraburkholderia fungorum]|uniref:Ribokinase n=1 Tax=Paraburkholderia fungorum TaxID=134537 RepID=A0A1H1JM70_9BURK|nr:ribokinase [Paraburkholderia fungorum]SDR51073.1 ribokinase [Paraburkholderia fungorum]
MAVSGEAGRVLVVGSINTDLVARTQRLPLAGETVLSGSLETVAGGKGANQAVAAARMGATVSMIAFVGNDAYGKQRLDGLAADGIDCAGIEVSEDQPTGLALITVSAAGENSIVVVLGSNGVLSPASIHANEERFRQCDVLVCQLETPPETVYAALVMARRHARLTVLNPGPATQPLPEHWYALIDYLVPNQFEASILAECPTDSAEGVATAAMKLHQKGARNVIVTLGGQGVHVLGDGTPGTHYPALEVHAVDTTAAGDTFVGALATKLATRHALVDAVKHAQIAASLCVQRHGAQPSIPGLVDVEACEDRLAVAGE